MKLKHITNQSQNTHVENVTDQTVVQIHPLSDAELDQVTGGLIGLLLPAVQKVREAASR